MLKALATERPVHNEEFSYYVNGKENVQLCNAGSIYNDGKLVGAYTVQRDLTVLKDMVERNIALQNELIQQKTARFLRLLPVKLLIISLVKAMLFRSVKNLPCG